MKKENLKHLVDIRCPHTNRSQKDDRLYPCKKLCIKVMKGGSGEAFCTRCKKTFYFETKENGEVMTVTKLDSYCCGRCRICGKRNCPEHPGEEND